MTKRIELTLTLLLLALAGCNADVESTADAAKTAAEKLAGSAGVESSPGKPSAPVNIEYSILGTPLISQPLAIEVRVASAQPGQSLQLSYFINDTDSLVFADAQPERIDVQIPEGAGIAARQVRVVPMREGRLFLNVTAEVETEAGSMLKSIAIPIVVGSSGAALEINGELKQTADGETVISMPAREN